ncbi:potassium channel regulatory protein [Tachyglossus aculeatus]|uniref:potassium channel regulatory protein n=1 Tax=Tachyglossus aculeatus TaxID=9261 RepID=UPI0018F559D8|nr:potassium channel regulatory protein [Tachyglossus aculeatus]
MSSQETITLNVGGMKFTTRLSTLKQFPASRLARMLDGGDPEFRLVNGQFFVDRDGVLFSYILDFLRTHLLALPADFSDYLRLQREVDFYRLDPLARLLNQKHLLKPRPELLEVRFLCQDTRAFFRIFGSSSHTVEVLTGRITEYWEQPSAQTWSSDSSPAQTALLPFPPQRPSYHDLIFQCGTDSTTGEPAEARYVSINPDDRKLINGTNVLGLLVDTLLKEGFHLISTRTVSSEENVECYSFQRINRPEALTLSEAQKPENYPVPTPVQSQKKK